MVNQEDKFMKANNGSGNIPERDEWKTPKKLWNNLNHQYNFGFDYSVMKFKCSLCKKILN